MPDYKPLIEAVNVLAADLIMADLAVTSELDAILKKIGELRNIPAMKELPCARMIISASTAVSMVRKMSPSKPADILNCLTSAIQEVLSLLERGQDTAERVKDFNERIKGIVSQILPPPPSTGAVVSQNMIAGKGGTTVSVKSDDPPAAFVSQPPVLELTSGADLYNEFVNEGFEHLTNSERSVLILESSPNDKEAINNIFRAFHTIKGAAGFMDLRDIRVLAHEAETMLDMVRKGALNFNGRVVELTLSSVDLLRRLLSTLSEQAAAGGKISGEYPHIGPMLGELKEVITSKVVSIPVGEILIKQGAITPVELAQALDIQKDVAPDKKVGEILVETNAASAKQVDSALLIQKSGTPVENSIKIQLDKLDQLIDLVGELVISETQVVQSPSALAVLDQKFHKNIGELDQITRRLQQLVMGMRLVQIGPSFQKMVRLVRDLSKKMGKDVVITLSGEETEIDKNMVELVSDPLMHMVRNSVDHGIEPADIRVANGKPAQGKVELAAFHKGGNVVIEIRDDGGGLRKDKILKKAIERGLVKEGEELSDKRIFNLIFEAGFSTADKVTDVSGRGVGMDVVKRNIEKLRGKIEISSEEGKGSVFSIHLPITLAIIEGIVVQCGEEKYILPINSIVEFVKAQEKDRSQVYDKTEMYRVFGDVYPLIRLSDLFGVTTTKQVFEEHTICIVESDYGRACVLVDELLGQQQVVIKSLGERLKNVEGVSGSAILGDGRVGLILDVNGLVGLAVK
jgi:two-component system chemotaxis sensor kinase CheA